MRVNDSFLHSKNCPPRPQIGLAREQWQKFEETLQNAIEEVDTLQKKSDQLTEEAVLGKVENLLDVMIAAEKARTAMNLTLEVRNKALDAYKEIMRLNF